MIKYKWLGVLLSLAALSAAKPSLAHTSKPFFLSNGDTVVFYGDSITEQLAYGRDIETFVDTRFPKMNVSFINSGWSGDTVRGGGGGPIDVRLKRDVLPYKPSVVTIFLGMNDGGYTSFTEANYQTYTKGLTHIVDTLRRDLPGVRLTLLTPSYFDYHAKARPPLPAGTNYNYSYPAPDYNQTLLRYGAFVKLLGAVDHIPVADVNLPLKEATQVGRLTNPNFALSPEGVHPFEDGHLIMAAAVLKSWHALSTVAKITLRPNRRETITTLLPWPVPMAAQEAFRISPLPGSLNRDTLYGRHLSRVPSTRYELIVDGADIATLSAAQLRAGVSLTQFPSLPQNVQAQKVLALVDQRTALWHSFFKGRHGIATAADIPTAAETQALQAENLKLNALRTQAHQAAQPMPHTFELVSAAAQP